MNEIRPSSLPQNREVSQVSGRRKTRKKIFLQKKKRKADLEAEFREKFSENRMYYEKLADKYHVFRSLTAFLLAIWMVCGAVFAYSMILNDGFRYVHKVLKINPANLDARYHTISYAAGNGASFAFYKDDLAVIGEGKLAVYDLSGDLRFHAQAKHSSKAFAVSDKYLALYSPGEKGFSLYNSFSCVYEHSFPGAIRTAAVSDSGKFAVCFKENEKNTIEVYHKNFKKAFSLSLPAENIIYSLALSPNGDKLAVTTISMKGGIYGSEFTVYDVSSKKMIVKEKADGKKPIAASFFDNGRIFFAAEGILFFYQANGKNAETVTLPSSSYAVFRDGNEISLLCDSSHVYGYSSKGALLTDFPVKERIFDVKVRDGRYYILSDRTVEVYEKDGVRIKTCEIRSGAKDFFVLDDRSLLICYISETKRILP
ncbi:MAG: hypothetical protein IJA86_00825 [Clostridia bacterium]|nr:hypothetical protein [Clostridia bacterium]